MAKLYFRNSYGNEELCGIGNINEKNVVRIVLNELANRNPSYVSHYQRTWRNDAGELWIDVGSWDEFYILRDFEGGDDNGES